MNSNLLGLEVKSRKLPDRFIPLFCASFHKYNIYKQLKAISCGGNAVYVIYMFPPPLLLLALQFLSPNPLIRPESLSEGRFGIKNAANLVSDTAHPEELVLKVNKTQDAKQQS